MTDYDDNADGLPESLIERLRAADQPPATITPQVDRAVASLAKAHFGKRPPAWRRPAIAAAAAVALLALFVMPTFERSIDESSLIYGDIDGSGAIDIADVLALARGQGGEPPSQADIDAFALRIVALRSAGDER